MAPSAPLLGLTHPIVLAPMGGIATGLLAGRVARAGGLGLISAGASYTAEWYLSELDVAEREMGGKEEGALGVGFITWVLLALPVERRARLLESVLSRPSVRAVHLSFGDHTPLIAAIRSLRPDVVVMHQLHSPREALVSLRAGLADAIVVQGTEAGGHGRGGGKGVGLMVLLPEVVREVRRWEKEEGGRRRVPVLAAGGISTGAQVAACLRLGADGCPPLREAWKARIAAAGSSEETVRTLLYDRTRAGGREQGWEMLGYDGRVMHNDLTIAYESPDASDADRASLVRHVEERGGQFQLPDDEGALWAGAGIGLIEGNETVEQAMRDLVDGAVGALKGASDLVPPVLFSKM
ncbi:hypothetical protein DFJ74DRAFT_725929 [Hyaloraphidium curvatum]|nr:hypothetical protein DFJ74DRAFT_725929 [Hyaloraphidium curvatum]